MEKQSIRFAGAPGGAVRPHEAKLDILARIADAFWICAALFIACAFYPEVWEVRHSMAAAFAVLLFYMVGQAQGLYRAWRAEPVKSERFIRGAAMTWGREGFEPRRRRHGPQRKTHYLTK